MKRLAPVMLSAMLLAAPQGAGAQQGAPQGDAAEIASRVFLLGCARHYGKHDDLKRLLQPGGEMYLPRLQDANAEMFLAGRNGEAYDFPNRATAIALVLFEDGQCSVFVEKVEAERLYLRLRRDLAEASDGVFRVEPAGRQDKGGLLTRFLDMVPDGAYRQELKKQLGREPEPALRVTLATADAANTALQAVITFGRR